MTRQRRKEELIRNTAFSIMEKFSEDYFFFFSNELEKILRRKLGSKIQGKALEVKLEWKNFYYASAYGDEAWSHDEILTIEYKGREIFRRWIEVVQ